MLTNAAVRSARVRARPYKLFDGGGLYLFVAPTGLKSWRLKYRLGRGERTLTIGQYPEISIEQARHARDQARASIAVGEDPTRQSRREEPRTLEQASRSWFDARRERWSEVHAADVIGSLERHIFPAIGNRPIGVVGADELLDLLARIEGEGAIETARRIRQRLDMVFRFAASPLRRWATSNPAADLGDELSPPRAVERHAAVTTQSEARATYRSLSSTAARPVVNLAAQFLALTAVRVGTLRLAQWDEMRLIDGELVWQIPARHMKLSKERKASDEYDHIVPLTPAAYEVLMAARDLWSGDAIFPIGERAIGALHDRAGLRGRHVPHGWRASFSTILNEAMPAERDAIDEALAHRAKGKVEAAYNRAVQLQRRRAIYDAWASILICAETGI
jgi:integrase